MFQFRDCDKSQWLLYVTPQETGAEAALGASVSDSHPPSHQEEQTADVLQGDPATADPETRPETGPDTEEEEQTDVESRDKRGEQEETEGVEGTSDGEEGKGVKRKRDEAHQEEEAEQSTEKKKVKVADWFLNITPIKLYYKHLILTVKMLEMMQTV